MSELPDQLLHFADRLDAGKAAADDDEGQQRLSAPGLGGDVGILETAEHPIADVKRIHHVLHHQRAIGEAGRPAEIDHLAEGDHQLVVSNGPDPAVAAQGHVHGLRPKIDLADFRDHDCNARQKTPQRSHAVAGIDAAPCDLGQQWLKDEEVVATDQHDLDITASVSLEVLGREDAAEIPHQE